MLQQMQIRKPSMAAAGARSMASRRSSLCAWVNENAPNVGVGVGSGEGAEAPAAAMDIA